MTDDDALAHSLARSLTQISEAYGVLTDEGIALRGLFIIDREGVVQHATINNLAFGRSVDETLRVLQALQYVQVSNRPLTHSPTQTLARSLAHALARSLARSHAGQPGRGVPRGMEAGGEDHEAGPDGVEGVLRRHLIQ